MSNKNARHSSATSQWYTPEWLVEKTRNTMGSIDLDPASDLVGNGTVKASQFISVSSLSVPWVADTVFLNPPGQKIGNKSQAVLFWDKLVREYEAGNVKQAIFVGFSLEILQTSQLAASGKSVGNFVVCVPKKRVHFMRPEGKRSPTHANVIAYLHSDREGVNRFVEQFKDVGVIMNYSEDHPW